MQWTEMTSGHYYETVRLLNLIDIVAGYNFTENMKDESFDKWVTKRYFDSKDAVGVMVGYKCDGYLTLYFSFDPDIPHNAEAEVKQLLQTIGSARIWCNAENMQIISLISGVLSTCPSYWAREMSVTHDCFATWKKPVLPVGYQIKGYLCPAHDAYINLLEDSMTYTPKGYYVKQSDSLRKTWSNSSSKCTFNSIWRGDTVVGMCFGSGLEIQHLAVAGSHRGKGFGYTLLHKTIDKMYQKQRDDDGLCLYVVDSNEGAYEFYLNVGMRVTGHSARFTI
jgi:ribosomal protein S18 acetylase RimI-like enzyme